jgi:glutamine amidotransferase-like uncharacterized protein
MTLVYAGEGSSHSWTWLADLFEVKGIRDVRFLGSDRFTEELRDDVRTVIVSGGDGLKIASSLGAHGFAHLKGYIHRGGTYVGICAGAYLPLPSSIDPLNKFNLSTTRIENIDCSISSETPRISVRYGSCSIVHPIRGEMELEGVASLNAPVYGGPIFKDPERDEVLLRYRQFTGSTEFQMDRARATSMILGRPAALRVKHGLGELLLLGPHLEHPRYPVANDLFMHLPRAGFGATSPFAGNARAGEADPGLLRSVADVRVAILGLENRSFLVGNKLWDGSRFLELVDSIDKRASTCRGQTISLISDMLDRARQEILSAKDDSFEYADEGPQLLVEAARICIDSHFSAMREKA